eukprot:c45202_g1_i1 orf=300-491(+)
MEKEVTDDFRYNYGFLMSQFFIKIGSAIVSWLIRFFMVHVYILVDEYRLQHTTISVDTYRDIG